MQEKIIINEPTVTVQNTKINYYVCFAVIAKDEKYFPVEDLMKGHMIRIASLTLEEAFEKRPAASFCKFAFYYRAAVTMSDGQVLEGENYMPASIEYHIISERVQQLTKEIVIQDPRVKANYEWIVTNKSQSEADQWLQKELEYDQAVVDKGGIYVTKSNSFACCFDPDASSIEEVEKHLLLEPALVEG